MYDKTLDEVTHLIKANLLAEVITSTNGERKTTLVLNTGGSITFHGDEAKEVLKLTSRY